MAQPLLNKSLPDLQIHNPYQGILFMVFGIGVLTAMDAFVKALVQQSINPMQIPGLRIFIILTVILCVYAFRG